jgi:hypothetical protein
MKVFFSFDYKGGLAYLGMKEQPMMMDIQVTDVDKLLGFLELRLGLHTVSQSNADRLVAYYKCVRDYMKAHHDDAGNQLYGSYMVSPLATSREMLKWRDALAVCGWGMDTPAPSRRLKVLQGVEQLFSGKGFSDLSIRRRAIVERLKQRKGMMGGVVFVMPFDVQLLHPALKEIFALAVADGAKIERLAIPKIEGNNNLAELKRLLTAEKAGSMKLDPADDSVEIWNFKDDLEAEEYLAMLPDDAFDVSIQPDTKLTDNFLHMMGKPVTGSFVANSAPQIIQLFFTGVAIMERPLNIGALLQWLYAPIHPLPGNFRYKLAERLARTGGWLPDSLSKEEVQNDCCQLVQEWVSGKQEADEGHPIDQKEQEQRRHKTSVFLPDFEGGNENTMTAQKLHTFLKEMSAWSRQRAAIIAQDNPEDLRIAQLTRLSELCETLKNLTDDIAPTALVAFSEIEKHMACLYEPSEFVQYRAQATSRFTVSSPGQVAARADKVLWAGLHNFAPMLPATEFLTPKEYNILKEHIQLWDVDDVRKVQQQTLLLPLLFCQRQLRLVTVERVGNELVNRHPMIVRIEQQVENTRDLTVQKRIDDDSYVPVSALTNNAVCGNNGFYARISRTDLITWRKSESPTSIEKLMQNPIDYTLENIAYIRDNGQSDLGNIAITKGNVAHGVIQHLFYVPKDLRSGYAPAIRQRVEANYKTVFDRMVETKGAILLLQENAIERRQLFERLRECVDHLIDIIEKDHLHVVACEKQLKGNTFGTPNDQTPVMQGYADMVLARENGQHIIFDFKWTSSKNYYQGLLQKNRSSQLAIYAELMSELTDGKVPTAYFLMPRGRLYSTYDFKSYWASKIDVDAECDGDIISKIVNSYYYRREEIMSGKIETGEGLPLEQLDYFNDTEDHSLFPLKPQYGDEANKEINGFSSYTNLKN